MMIPIGYRWRECVSVDELQKANKRFTVLQVCGVVLLANLWFPMVSGAATPGETTLVADKQDMQQQYFQQIANRWIYGSNPETNQPAVLKGKIQAANEAYRLGHGDVLTITIPYLNTDPDSKDADRSRDTVEIVVRGNQDVAIPPFGAFPIEGMTLSQLTRMLEEMATYYLVNPRVYVSLKNTRPYTVYVTGQIKRPGAYQLTNEPTAAVAEQSNKVADNPENQGFFEPRLSYVIAKAGGLLGNSDLEHVQVTNRQSGKTLTANLLELLHGDNTQDILLQPEDVVLIPALANQKILPQEASAATFGPENYTVHVFGHISKSANGLTDVTLDGRSMTVMSALSKVNVDPKANLKKIMVLRKQSGSNGFTQYTVNGLANDFTLLPDDVIVLPNYSAKHRLAASLDAIVRLVWGATLLYRVF